MECENSDLSSQDQHQTKSTLYGRNISTKMRQELSPKAIILLDLFDGLWRHKGTVYLSNKMIADDWGWSVATVKRCLKELVDRQYIRCEYAENNYRTILPPGVVTLGSDLNRPRLTDEPTSAHDCTDPRLKFEPQKTLEDKNPKIENPPPPGEWKGNFESIRITPFPSPQSKTEELWNRWCDYRRKAKRAPLTWDALRRLVAQYLDDSARLEADINHSIDASYQKLVPNIDFKQRRGPKTFADVMAEIRAEEARKKEYLENGGIQ